MDPVIFENIYKKNRNFIEARKKKILRNHFSMKRKKKKRNVFARNHVAQNFHKCLLRFIAYSWIKTERRNKIRARPSSKSDAESDRDPGRTKFEFEGNQSDVKQGRRRRKEKGEGVSIPARISVESSLFRGHLPAKEFAFVGSPLFISNKAASLIVAPDKTVFVGDRGHSRRPKSTERTFSICPPGTPRNDPLLGPLSRAWPTTRKPISAPSNRALSIQI